MASGQVRQLGLAQLPDAAVLVDELAEVLGSLDVLVNPAGTGASAPFLETTYSDWRRGAGRRPGRGLPVL